MMAGAEMWVLVETKKSIGGVNKVIEEGNQSNYASRKREAVKKKGEKRKKRKKKRKEARYNAEVTRPRIT